MTLRTIIPLWKSVWQCDVCGVIVDQMLDSDQQTIIPVSKYWHAIKMVAYCSPSCSNVGHAK